MQLQIINEMGEDILKIVTAGCWYINILYTSFYFLWMFEILHNKMPVFFFLSISTVEVGHQQSPRRSKRKYINLSSQSEKAVSICYSVIRSDHNSALSDQCCLETNH